MMIVDADFAEIGVGKLEQTLPKDIAITLVMRGRLQSCTDLSVETR